MKETIKTNLKEMKDSLMSLTGQQVGVIILYYICTILVQFGAYKVAIKIFDFYTRLVQKLYEQYNLDYKKHSWIHSIIAILLAASIVYGFAYLIGYLFGKYVINKVFK